MNQVSQTPPEPFRQPPTIIIQPRRSNGLGTAGFILALIAMLGCWIPVLSWILWALGFLFSFIGIFKSPRGLAIARTHHQHSRTGHDPDHSRSLGRPAGHRIHGSLNSYPSAFIQKSSASSTRSFLIIFNQNDGGSILVQVHTLERYSHKAVLSLGQILA